MAKSEQPQRLNTTETAKNVNSTSAQQMEREDYVQLPLVKRNFILMAIAGLMIVVGFLLMTGDGSSAETFNYDIFSTRRIVVGPTLAFIGFVFMGVAIIIGNKKKTDKK